MLLTGFVHITREDLDVPLPSGMCCLVLKKRVVAIAGGTLCPEPEYFLLFVNEL